MHLLVYSLCHSNNLQIGGLADIPREGYDDGKLVLGEGFKSLNKMAMDMFGKPVRELNADEMEQLREEFNISKGITEAKDGYHGPRWYGKRL